MVKYIYLRGKLYLKGGVPLQIEYRTKGLEKVCENYSEAEKSTVVQGQKRYIRE